MKPYLFQISSSERQQVTTDGEKCPYGKHLRHIMCFIKGQLNIYAIFLMLSAVLLPSIYSSLYISECY